MYMGSQSFKLDYTMLYAAFFVMVVLRLNSVGANGEPPLSVSDEELTAIKSLHGLLDDNRDGKLDVHESQDFVRSELGHPEGTEKSHMLHHNDLFITFEELWEAWQKSEVYHWTNKDIVAWLENQVELSCYSERFQQLNITGRHLPSIAVNAQQFIQLVLKITNIQHRTKLSVRAMDIVLFGPPHSRLSYWKDGIVLILLTLCIILSLWAVFQRRHTQKRVDCFLEESRVYEKELNELKKKLEQWQEAEEEEEVEGKEEEGRKDEDEGRKEEEEEEEVMEDASDGIHMVPSEVVPQSEGSSVTPSLSSNSLEVTSLSDVRSIREEELASLREKLKVLEGQLETQHANRDTLRPMLVQCYRREQKYLDSKKRRAEEDVLQAQLMCEKIRKKRSTIIDTFRLANSSALEDASIQMNKAINKMQKMTDSLEEYHERWGKIEQLCGFSVCHTSTVLTEGSPGHHPTRKISRTISPSAPGPTSSGANQTTGMQQEPLTNTEVPTPSRKPFQALTRLDGGLGSQHSLSRDTSERQSMKLGRVSSITTTDSSNRGEELGGSPASTLTRRKPF